MTIMVKPDSDFCYEYHVFTVGKQCPDFDNSVPLEPRCRKYSKVLSWTVSGRVLKCDECLREELCSA